MWVSKALLNVGEVEKAAEPGAKQPPETAAGTCGCNKSCNCTKAAVGFSDLYSTGTKVHCEAGLILRFIFFPESRLGFTLSSFHCAK